MAASTRAWWSLPGCFALLVLGMTRGAESNAELAEDEKTLHTARVATDGPALLAYFRERTLSDPERERLAGLIRQLGDEAFPVREQATQDLERAGRRAR